MNTYLKKQKASQSFFTLNKVFEVIEAYITNEICLNIEFDKIHDFRYDFTTFLHLGKRKWQNAHSSPISTFYPRLHNGVKWFLKEHSEQDFPIQISEHIQMYPNMSKHIQTYQNIYEHIGMYPSISECIRTYRNVSEPIRMDQNVSELIQTILNISYKYIEHFPAGTREWIAGLSKLW